ncbi:MAG: CPBP family intramembrane metalloprotease [Candidatus Micrarchaeota archaeon]|nr:CPBP family intramembrane metalloprotease [Candidatus Micrarchaeota archaeon]
MKIGKTDLVYLALPLVLWPLSFIVLQSVFIYALAASTAVLACLSLLLYMDKIVWSRGSSKIIVLIFGAAAAIVLYAIFVFGGAAASALGLGSYVSSVYASIYGSQGKGLSTIFLLALIGLFEEIYWRGGVQGYAAAKSKRFAKVPWVASTAYYTFVHIATLNPILVVSALFVGLCTGIVAHKAGILASTVTHILWIEAIVVFFPVVL